MGQHETIPTLTAAAAEWFGDLVAVVDGGTTLTFPELYEEARTFRRRARGVGDRSR